MTHIGLAFLVVITSAAQEPHDPLREEFDRIVGNAGFPFLKEVSEEIFSKEEDDFVRGATRLNEAAGSPVGRKILGDLGLIAFRRARAMKWSKGHEAAEALIVTYFRGPHDRSPKFRQAVMDLLKDAPDAPARKTLRLIAAIEGEADREFLLELAKDKESRYRTLGLHALAALDDPADTALIATLLKDGNPALAGFALKTLGQRSAVEYLDDIAACLHDPHLTAYALEALGKMKAQKHIRAIARLFEEEDREAIRHIAYRVLRDLDGETVADSIARLLSHEEQRVRLMTVRLLGQWKIPRSEGVLAVALRDEEAPVREAAVEALVHLQAKGSVEAIAARLDDSEADVRSRAAVGLGKLGASRFADRIAASGKSGAVAPGAAAEALLRMNPPARPDDILELLDSVARSKPPVISGCGTGIDFERSGTLGLGELATLMCERGLDDSVVTLIERSSKYRPGLRQGFLHSVARHGGNALAKALDKRGLLTDQAAQEVAISALSRGFAAKDVPLLMDWVRRLDPQSKQFLSFASGWLLPHTEELLKFADDDDPTVRRLIVNVLSQDRSLRHVARLLKFAKDPAPAVRAEVAKIADHIPSTDLDDALGELLKDPEPEVAHAAAQSVGQLKLIRFAPDVNRLTKVEKCRITAMYCLVRLGAKEHSASLVPLLSDPESGSYAAQWLGQLGAPERVADLLLAADTGNLKTRVEAIRAAAVLGGPIPKLADLLVAKEGSIRAAAADAAGTLRDRSQMGTLAAMLKDSSKHARAEAILALANLDAREHLPYFMSLLEQDPGPRDEDDDGSDMDPAVPAAVDAVGRLGTAESARELARHLRLGRTHVYGGRLIPDILRLDPKPHMALILKHLNTTVGFLDLNRHCGPKLFESIASQTREVRRVREYGAMDRHVERLSTVLPVKITVDPSVPGEVRRREQHLHGLAADRNAALHSSMHAWPECVLVYDEKAGEVKIMPVEEAKRFWLAWAKAAK